MPCIHNVNNYLNLYYKPSCCTFMTILHGYVYINAFQQWINVLLLLTTDIYLGFITFPSWKLKIEILSSFSIVMRCLCLLQWQLIRTILSKKIFAIIQSKLKNVNKFPFIYKDSLIFLPLGFHFICNKIEFIQVLARLTKYL